MQRWQLLPPSVVTTAIRSFLCSSSSPDASTSCDRTTPPPPAACTSVTSWTAPPSLTAGTATALKSIVGPMCAGHTGFVSTSAGRKSRPFTSYTGYANPGVSGISSLLYSTGFTARQILSGWALAAACQVLVIWVPPLPPSCKT